MKVLFKYLWPALLLLLAMHGVNVIRDEWKRKSIHDHGKIAEVKIEGLMCALGVMTFHFETMLVEKKIDARTCVLLNEGQTIKLKHSEQYPDTFLFVNEQSPYRFISGSLEIALGMIGLMGNWPLFNFRRNNFKKIKAA